MILRFRDYRIHGDNIVECERAVTLVRAALGNAVTSWSGPEGSPVCPRYRFKLEDASQPSSITLLPGFGRWNEDILAAIRARGGGLREAADVIITGVANGTEEPLLSIEFCGALPAGNQAWQRSGRAFSFAKAAIPYLYVAELGGYELGEGRVRKAARLPNPAVPFSYVSFSLSAGTPTLPVFVASPGADLSSRATYASVFADDELLEVVRASVAGEEIGAATERARRKALAFVEIKARDSRRGATLTPEQWAAAYSALLSGRGLLDYLAEETSVAWAKTTSIPLTDTAASLMQVAAERAVGLTAKDLPMCLVPRANRAAFAVEVERIYRSRLSDEFSQWLRREEHLAICWVAGFKPRHDDARPDRGLAPLTRMLIGPNADLLSVIYGPASPRSWRRLDVEPQELINENGLWEAVLSISDAILGDSHTDQVRRHGYVRSHWSGAVSVPPVAFNAVEPVPLRIGENDVDTVIHLVLGRLAGEDVFEGLCNPPGGDWSGISLLAPDRSKELRWLTLPRVGADSAKRPDHVLQFFDGGGVPLVLAVESKEKASSVEDEIGTRLVRYIETLLATPASIERDRESSEWRHSTTMLEPRRLRMASAVAFVKTGVVDLAAVARNSGADLVLAVEFGTDGAGCTISARASTPLGQEVARRMAAVDASALRIAVRV